MRLSKELIDIDYKETKRFFENRMVKYNDKNPYSVTMYQDNNEELVKQRNDKEIKKLLPLLDITRESKILDVACGIGRWADAINEEIEEYCGVDFCEGLIEIAKRRNKKEFVSFYKGSINNIAAVLKDNNKGDYNVILMIGILMYLNDYDLYSVFKQIEQICEPNAVLCIREPIGIQNRLTLKDFYSDDLQENYNAIYRTKDELKRFFQDSLLNKGFSIFKEGFLFEDALNNRKETSQYYFILKR